MAFTKMALKMLVDDFNKRGLRPYGKLLTLSRYALMFNEGYFERICQAGGWNIINTSNYETGEGFNTEVVFSALGFEQLDSMDYSEYEGANIIHDLNNTNIPKELNGKYDFILDCGTIEHVFHFGNVMENIFKMLKVGGTFIFNQPTFYGLNHGYYNFSPCLYYEYFKANNYELNTFIPYAEKNGFVYIADPVVNNICGHIPLIENSFNLVCGSVTKTAQTTYDVIPYQGQYVNAWKQHYNNSSINNTTIIYDALDLADESSVYLYGTGGFVRVLLQNLPSKYRRKVLGLISKDVDEIGQVMYGCKVYALDEVMDSCSVIIIAVSEQYQNIVYDRIRHVEHKDIKIVRFFN